MEKIQVYIITHNRPALLLNSIESVLIQSYSNIELIISDNSSNNLTKEVLENKQYYPKLTYIKRKTLLGPIEHLNCVLKEITANYFMIFHDDDVMSTNMISELYTAIVQNIGTIAVGANAVINKNGKDTKKLFLNSDQKNVILNCRDDVVHGYLKAGNVPFPAYLYKKKIATQLHFDISHGGKYCDVAFIMDIAALGRIIFLANPLMTYFYHKGQGSAKNDFLDNIKLINYITKTTKYNRKDPIVINFRLKNVYCELKSELLNRYISVFSNRYFKILNLFFLNFHIKLMAKSFILGIWSLLSLSKLKYKINKLQIL